MIEGIVCSGGRYDFATSSILLQQRIEQAPSMILPLFPYLSGVTLLVCNAFFSQAGACSAFSCPVGIGDETECCKLWINGCDKNNPPTKCIKYNHYSIDYATVDLYHQSENWDSTKEPTKKHIQAIYDTLNELMPIYLRFGKWFDLSLHVIPIPAADGEFTTGEADFDALNNLCHVRIDNNIPEDMDFEDTVNQTVAHELYHCVQGRDGQPRFWTDGSQWLTDGSAEYFADYYYRRPKNWANPGRYDPSKPLHSQTYPASLFFIFLMNQGWTLSDINAFVFRQPVRDKDLSSPDRHIASRDPDVVAMFPLFAQAYKDGTLKYSDQVSVDPAYKMKSSAKHISLTRDGSRRQLHFEEAPFTMKHRLRSLDAGASYSINFLPSSPKTVVSYRASGQTSWSQLTDNAVTFDIPCFSEDNNFELIFTSTADLTVATGDVIITRTSTHECVCRREVTKCDEGSATAGSIDPCLVGNWDLNLPALHESMQNILSNLSSGQLMRNFAVSGSGAFSIDSSSEISTLAFNHTKVSYDLEISGTPSHTDLDISGSTRANIVMQGQDRFVWRNVTATGEAVTTVTFEGSPITTSIPLSGQYGDGVEVDYTCTSKTLELRAAAAAGTITWSYSFDRMGEGSVDSAALMLRADGLMVFVWFLVGALHLL